MSRLILHWHLLSSLVLLASWIALTRRTVVKSINESTGPFWTGLAVPPVFLLPFTSFLVAALKMILLSRFHFQTVLKVTLLLLLIRSSYYKSEFRAIAIQNPRTMTQIFPN